MSTRIDQLTEDVKTTASISAGASSVADTGAVRVGHGAASVIAAKASGGATTKVYVASVDASDNLSIGANASQAIANINSLLFFSSNTLQSLISGVEKVVIRASTFESANPIIGFGSPYGSHSKATVTTVDSFSVVSADYAKFHIRLTGTGAGTVTFPAGNYHKFIANPTLSTKTITNGAGTTVALLTGTGAIIGFDDTGCFLMAAATTVT